MDKPEKYYELAELKKEKGFNYGYARGLLRSGEQVRINTKLEATILMELSKLIQEYNGSTKG